MGVIESLSQSQERRLSQEAVDGIRTRGLHKPNVTGQRILKLLTYSYRRDRTQS